jgi:N-acetylneuraminic acid mutarotase
MERSRIILGLLVLSFVLCVVSCGGGGGSSEPTSSLVWITSPTSIGTYQTEDTTVRLGGGSFIPADATCPQGRGTLPPEYLVSAYNSANAVYVNVTPHLTCWGLVILGWDSKPIPLVLGSNTITVTATDGTGKTGRETIIVTRLVESKPPTVASTSPIAGATDIDVMSSVTVAFSEAMDSTSINTITILLKDSLNNPIAASVVYDATQNQARLTPSSRLAYNENYTVSVTTGAQDTSGNTLAAPYILGFTTGASNDLVAPTILSVSPASGSTCAATSGAVTATFDEDMDPATIDSNSFLLSGPGGSPVSGNVAYLNRTALYTPSVALNPGTSYEGNLLATMTDLAGNPLAAPYQWSFTTSASSGEGTWLPISTDGAPIARSGHVAVWTGSEMIVAGGWTWDSTLGRYALTDQFGRYNPSTDTWIVDTGAMATAGQTAVWTGSGMLVWGGIGVRAGGSRYVPGATWTAMSTIGQPTPRDFHTAVWTGSEMIVWGGNSDGTLDGDGARYNPDTDTWQTMSATNAPSARLGHTAVWTGTEMIVWGGVGITNEYLADGASYNPTTDSWTSISIINAPSARWGHAAAWIGDKMFVWGEMNGGTNTGGLYDPTTNSWTATDEMCAPSARNPGKVVWTGTKIVIWGGLAGSSLDDGYTYDPIGNTWSKITATGSPSVGSELTAVWTGSQVIFWGGSSFLNTGGILTP